MPLIMYVNQPKVFWQTCINACIKNKITYSAILCYQLQWFHTDSRVCCMCI